MNTLLEQIRTELGNRKGQISRISKETGISHDTLSRIRDNEDYDPGYSKVVTLTDYLDIDPCSAGGPVSSTVSSPDS